ncbi:MAG: cobalt ECF transporter T component CbiQ [Magnetococcus sp. DMHC-1]|nr:cobalt ECF transporter T component CbiQ [Magnetococcales bacterium]
MTGEPDSRKIVVTLDQMARGNSAVHLLEPRVKLVVTLLFLLCVLSFDKYAVSGLLPFFLFPLILVARAELSSRWLLHRLLLLAPLPLLIGLFNPFLDTRPIPVTDSLTIGGGWLSLLSIGLRFLLAMSAILVLTATTRLPDLGRAAERLGVPRIFVTQILLLYRYLFVLVQEAEQMARARNLRSFGRRGQGWSIHARLVGHLLLRAMHRAERVHQAMLCRGFHGSFPVAEATRLQSGDWRFLIVWLLILSGLRFGQPVVPLGALILGHSP